MVLSGFAFVEGWVMQLSLLRLQPVRNQLEISSAMFRDSVEP